MTQRRASEWTASGGESMSHGPDAVRCVATAPESITVLVAGGSAGGFSAVVPLWAGGANSRSVTKEVAA